MKRSFHSKKAIVALSGLVGVLTVCVALAQQSVSLTEWKFGIWRNFQLSKKAGQIGKDNFANLLTIDTNNSVAGQLALVAKNEHGAQHSNTQTIETNQNKLFLLDINAIKGEVGLTSEYVASPEKPGSNHGAYPHSIDGPQFSSTGQYILLKFRLDYSTYFPLILNTQTGDFRGLTTVIEGRNATPGVTGMVSWSADDQYIAYFEPIHSESGETVDELAFASEPRTAYVQNWRANTRLRVVQAQGIVDPLTWLDDKTLLYSALTHEQKKIFDLYDVTKTGKLPRPNIYGYDVATQRTKLIIKDGFRPSASPDGSLIAFFGSYEVTKPQPLYLEQNSPLWLWRYFCRGASLCVAKPDGSERIALQPYVGLYPQIQWLPDNRRFITLELTKSGLVFESEVTLWDTKTQTLKKLAKLYATKSEKPNPTDPYDRIAFPFSIKGVSQDGKKVFVISTSTKKTDVIQGPYPPSVQVLQSVDIETGVVNTIATVKNALGLDWTTKVNSVN
jgi:Tol biopolymer transport system component